MYTLRQFWSTSVPADDSVALSPQAKGIIRAIYDNGVQDDAIHTAACRLYGPERLQVIRILCNQPYACNIHFQDSYGNTVLHTLAHSLPPAYGANNPYLADGLHTIQALIQDKHVKTNVKNHYGNTIFHDLVQRGDDLIARQTDNSMLNVVEALLNYNDLLDKPPNAFCNIRKIVNHDGNSLLHLAAAFGQPKMTILLSTKGWDEINCVNADRLTPLHYTVVGNTQGHVEVAQHLIRYKNIKAVHVQTAFAMTEALIKDNKATKVTAQINQLLEEKLEQIGPLKNRESEEAQGINLLNNLHCTVSFSGMDGGARPKWVPGIRCRQREQSCDENIGAESAASWKKVRKFL